MKHKLTVVAGAGRPHVVEDPERYRGSIQEALETFIAREIQDPTLRALIQDPHLALETYGTGPHGDDIETPVCPTEQWKTVLAQLQHSDVELGIARRHEGGGGAR